MTLWERLITWETQLMTEWVSQGDAVALLAADDDKISQPALSQYLAGHPEIERKVGGPGRPTMINLEQLRASRGTRRSRGPASTPSGELDLPPPAVEQAPEAETVSPAPRGQSEMGQRKSSADVMRAEADARRARILADEAEGLMIRRDDAISAFRAAGIALVRAFEQRRHVAIAEIRAAKDPREAAAAMEKHEQAIRLALASALTKLAAEPEALSDAA